MHDLKDEVIFNYKGSKSPKVVYWNCIFIVAQKHFSEGSWILLLLLKFLRKMDCAEIERIDFYHDLWGSLIRCSSHFYVSTSLLFLPFNSGHHNVTFVRRNVACKMQRNWVSLGAVQSEAGQRKGLPPIYG